MVDVTQRIEIGHKSGLSLQNSEWKAITQSCQQSRQCHKIESKSCAEINLEPNITSWQQQSNWESRKFIATRSIFFSLDFQVWHGRAAKKEITQSRPLCLSIHPSRQFKGKFDNPYWGKTYNCNQYNNVFRQARYLRSHLKIHCEEKSYKCNQCDRAA